MIYISEYEVDRCYGGPEEGGWWYDAPEHIRVLAVASTQDDANAICRALNQVERDESDGPDRFSVIGSPDTVFYSEDTPGEYELRERPHYC